MLTTQISHFISIDDIDKEEMIALFEKAKWPIDRELTGKVMATLFYEPSTRTRLSFESACLKLGGSVIGFSDMATSSVEKGETLSDTIRIVQGLSDLIVLRHPKEGAARLASEFSSVPVINGGDGSNEHPTQTLTDIFTLWDTFDDINNFEIGISGDLKYSRTINSLVRGLKHFSPKISFICSPELEPPPRTLDVLKENRIKFAFYRSFDEIIDKLDVLYMTRRQLERSNLEDAAPLAFSLKTLEKAKPTLKILHPLPRQKELPVEIDKTDHALYFKQADNGLIVRQALIHTLLRGL